MSEVKSIPSEYPVMEMYSAICDKLRACCDRHGLGQPMQDLADIVPAAVDNLVAERDRLRANLDEAAKAHAADFAALGDAKARIVNFEQYQWYMRNVLAEYGLNDVADDTPFCTQLREKLAARDAAQQRAGAVKALRELVDQNDEALSIGDLCDYADAIEKGTVAL